MSFILDALKKSESDRQRQSGPSLFEVKVAPPRRTLPIWAVAIAVLLGINVIVISWMLLRHPAAQPAAASTQAAPAAAAPSRDTVRAAPAARAAVAPPVQGSTTAGQAASTAHAASAVASPSAPSAAHAGNTGSSSAPPPSASGAPRGAGQPAASDNAGDYAPAVEPAPASSAASGDAAGDLPLYQQIVASDGLPALHLDLHVFATRPRDRFAMINMHKVGEGDTLPSGAHVDAIRADGVVLSYRGTRFLLPRN